MAWKFLLSFLDRYFLYPSLRRGPLDRQFFGDSFQFDLVSVRHFLHQNMIFILIHFSLALKYHLLLSVIP